MINEIKENFAMLNNEDKYSYLLDLANMLPSMEDKYKTEENLIKGCASKVFMKLQIQNGKINLSFDSDSQIVKGILYILYILLNGTEISNAKSFNFAKILKDIGLNDLLTSSRQNGLVNIINAINNALK